MKPIFRLLFFILFSKTVFAQPIGRYALLVGIGEYPKESGWPKLHSDEAANRLATELKKRNFLDRNVHVLTNEEATYENIRLGLRKLLQEAEPQDQVFVYLGGHSQQITDLSGDEADHLDEAFVPYDAGLRFKKNQDEGNSHFKDDEIQKWINRLADKVTRDGSMVWVYDAGISKPSTIRLPQKGKPVPFVIPGNSFLVKEEQKNQDNDWLDFNYSLNFSQVLTLDNGPAGEKFCGEIPEGKKGFVSPVCAALIKGLQAAKPVRFRELEPWISSSYQKSGIAGGFRMEGPKDLPTYSTTQENILKIQTEQEDQSAKPYKVFSLIIGVSEYKEVEKLSYSDDDARYFSETLKSVYGKLLQKENHFVYLDSEALKKPVIDALEKINAEVSENDKVYFFFAGHGDVENLASRKAHLLLYNATSNVYKSGGGTLPIEDLKDYFSSWIYKKAKVFLVVDACKSGKLAGGIAGQGEAARNLQQIEFRSARLLSCQPNEKSVESDMFGGGHGAFTYYLVKGLSGLANTDGDKKISVGEIGSFLSDSVSNKTFRFQNPLVEGNRKLEFFPAFNTPAFDPVAYNGQNQKAILRNSIPADDSLKVRWKRELKAHLLAGRILSPEKNCAREVFARCQNSFFDDKVLIEGIRQDLVTAIDNRTQKLISEYIKGNELTTSEHLFATSASELNFLLGLIDVDNPLYFMYLSRKYFCDGRSLSPEEFKKNRKSGVLQLAIKNLQSSLKYDPEGAHNYNAIGRLQQSNQQFDLAVASYKRAIQLAPGWKFPMNNLGTAFNDLGNQTRKTGFQDSALVYYRRALRVDSTYALAYKNMAKACLDKGQTEQAKKLYLKSIFLNPDNPEAYNSLGDLYRTIEKWDSAGYFLRQGLNMQPNNLILIESLGNLYFDQNYKKPEQKEILLEKAARQYRMALSLDPASIVSLYGIGNCFWESFKYDSAAFSYKLLLEHDSSQAMYFNGYIEALLKSGQEALAETVSAKVTRQFPDDALNWFDFGILAAFRNDFQSVEKRLQKAVSLGFTDKKTFEEEPLLETFRKSDFYKKLVRLLK